MVEYMEVQQMTVHVWICFMTGLHNGGLSFLSLHFCHVLWSFLPGYKDILIELGLKGDKCFSPNSGHTLILSSHIIPFLTTEPRSLAVWRRWRQRKRKRPQREKSHERKLEKRMKTWKRRRREPILKIFWKF